MSPDHVLPSGLRWTDVCPWAIRSREASHVTCFYLKTRTTQNAPWIRFILKSLRKIKWYQSLVAPGIPCQDHHTDVKSVLQQVLGRISGYPVSTAEKGGRRDKTVWKFALLYFWLSPVLVSRQQENPNFILGSTMTLQKPENVFETGIEAINNTK